jgi:protein TonB
MKHFILAAFFLVVFTGTAIASSKDGPCPPTITSNCIKPVYPDESLRAREQGLSVVRFLINTEGEAVDSQVTQSSGSSRLDEAAVKALRECKFKPGSRNGVPVETWMRIDYQWAIESPPSAERLDAGMPASNKE